MKQENHEMLEQIETMLYEYGRKVENKIKSNQEDETRLINEEIEVLKELIDEPIIYDEKEELLYQEKLIEMKSLKLERVISYAKENDEYDGIVYKKIKNKLVNMLCKRVSILHELIELIESSDDEMDKNLMVNVNERMECLLDDISETDEYKNNLVEFVLEKSGEYNND
ncbi:hypothetical protein ACFY6E_12430 [Staphylococcus cohnii]|uniref:hypothetical protein n=1 Tax=Staphylococcus cohnii TaxID=29382 RepID=UPI0036C7B437